MAESSFDSRPATRPNEIVFRGISPGRSAARFMFLTLVAAAVAWAFAGSIDFRTWLRVERRAARGRGLEQQRATVFFVCARLDLVQPNSVGGGFTGWPSLLRGIEPGTAGGISSSRFTAGRLKPPFGAKN